MIDFSKEKIKVEKIEENFLKNNEISNDDFQYLINLLFSFSNSKNKKINKAIECVRSHIKIH